MLIIDGDKIRFLRTSRKENAGQFDLATQADVAPDEISRIERGKVTNVTVKKLGKISKALGVEPGELLKEIKEGEVNGQVITNRRGG